MPKYLLLKHYRGGPELPTPVPPMNEWDPDDIAAHMAFLGQVGQMLQESGEFVDAQALSEESIYVRYGGPGAAPVTTDGPHPETSDLVAGCTEVVSDCTTRTGVALTCRRTGPVAAALCLSMYAGDVGTRRVDERSVRAVAVARASCWPSFRSALALIGRRAFSAPRTRSDALSSRTVWPQAPPRDP